MYLTLLLLPLIGGILANNRYVGKILGPRLSVSCLFLSVICLFCVFYEVGLNNSPVHLN